MISMMVLLSMVIYFIPNPFIMCLLVLSLTLVSCCMVSMFSSLWMSYALMIVFLGGMMVLFTYASSMSTCDKTSLSPNLYLSLPSIFFLFYFMSPVGDKLQMGSLYMGLGESVLLICTLYLLLCLLMVVKIVEVKKGCLVVWD